MRFLQHRWWVFPLITHNHKKEEIAGLDWRWLSNTVSCNVTFFGEVFGCCVYLFVRRVFDVSFWVLNLLFKFQAVFMSQLMTSGYIWLWVIFFLIPVQQCMIFFPWRKKQKLEQFLVNYILKSSFQVFCFGRIWGYKVIGEKTGAYPVGPLHMICLQLTCEWTSPLSWCQWGRAVLIHGLVPRLWSFLGTVMVSGVSVSEVCINFFPRKLP